MKSKELIKKLKVLNFVLAEVTMICIICGALVENGGILHAIKIACFLDGIVVVLITSIGLSIYGFESFF